MMFSFQLLNFGEGHLFKWLRYSSMYFSSFGPKALIRRKPTKPITRVRGYRGEGSQFWDFLYAFLRARLGSRAQQTPKKPSMIPKVYMGGVLS
jgi:hypothetical protein